MRRWVEGEVIDADKLNGRLPGIYNVAGYGATGDGVNDDTAEIQAALDSVALTSLSGGGTVVLPGGTYRVSSTINVPRGVWIEGVGCGPGSSAASPATTIDFRSTNTPLFQLDKDHCAVRNMRISCVNITALSGNVAVRSRYNGTTQLSLAPLIENLEIEYAFNSVIVDGSANCMVRNCTSYKSKDDAFVSKGAQGYWEALTSSAGEGNGFYLTVSTLGSGISPFMSGLHSFANKKWGIRVDGATGILLSGIPSFLNNDSLGEILINSTAAGFMGSIADVEMQFAGDNIVYPATNDATAPSIRIISTAGQVRLSNFQSYNSKGNGLDLQNASNVVSGPGQITGAGIGAQAGHLYAIKITGAGNVISGALTVSGITSIASNNNVMGGGASFGGSSASPIIDLASGTGNVFGLIFINQAGAGTAFTSAAGTSYTWGADVHVLAGSESHGGSILGRTILRSVTFASIGSGVKIGEQVWVTDGKPTNRPITNDADAVLAGGGTGCIASWNGGAGWKVSG